jgi:MFS family permease
VRRYSELTQIDKTLWQEFSVGLASIFFVAAGQGAFLILMVTYLEHRAVPIAENGLMQAFLSLVEGSVCLLAGYLYFGRYTRRIIAVGILFMAAGAFLFALQPLGMLAWLATGANGIGIGIIIVILYVSVLERRPHSLGLGTAIGLYTAGIAAGNAVGEVLSGIITDHWGFGASFSFSAITILVVLLMIGLIGRTVNHPTEGETNLSSQQPTASSHTSWVGKYPGWTWKLGIAAGFSMALVNTVFDTIFPIYGLRVGLTFSLVGTLAGLKMFLAAIVRPFSGVVIARLNAIRLNNLSLSGLAAATMLTPIVGVGFGLTALVCLMGLGFGTIRVTSATITLFGQNDPKLTSQRSGIYNTALSVGQIIGPWISGLMAGMIGLGAALTGLPAIFLLLYGLILLILPRLSSNSDLVPEERTI